ncbi:hypothetical protein [Sphingomonas panni]|nr:hypothetical protein [Sphingomonas panni]
MMNEPFWVGYPDTIMDVLRAGAELGRHVTERTEAEVMEGLDLSRL